MKDMRVVLCRTAMVFVVWLFRQSARNTCATPNALGRIVRLHLPHLEGTIPVCYSDGLKATALREQASIADCSSWYSRQLHVSVPVTLAVLNEDDWKRVGAIAAYPMAETLPEEGVVRPGMTAEADSLAAPTTLKPILPAEYLPSPRREDAIGYFGVRNASGRGIAVVDDGVQAVLPTGYTAEQGKTGIHLKWPSGRCLTDASEPGYVILR